MLEPDRLAAYLDDELDADARREVERVLASDQTARRRLEAMRRADDELATMAGPTPPAGFADRLDRHLDAVLSETLRGDTEEAGGTAVDADRPRGQTVTAQAGEADTTRTVPAAGDELATRRARRWVPAVAAAGLLVIAGGIAVTTLGGGDDEATFDTAGDAPADARIETFELDAAEDETDDAGLAAPQAPVIVDEGRTAAIDETDELLLQESLVTLADLGLDRTQGADTATSFQAMLGVDGGGTLAEDAPAGGDAGADAGDETAAATPDATPGPPELVTRDGVPVDTGTAMAIRRCLDELLEAGPAAIPVYVELLEIDARPAVAFGLVTIEPEQNAFTRRELWVLERASCQPVRFAQS